MADFYDPAKLFSQYDTEMPVSVNLQSLFRQLQHQPLDKSFPNPFRKSPFSTHTRYPQHIRHLSQTPPKPSSVD